MRVLAVAQAFKETLTVEAVAAALESGVRAAGAIATVILASDGGDGLMEALGPGVVRHTGHRVSGPLGSPVALDAGWLAPTTAVIESRMVCGLGLLPVAERDPSRTTTRGVGELIVELEAQGARQVFVGLGGSSTMDGGMGMARAWGWAPLDSRGRELPEGGGSLGDIDGVRAGRRPHARLIGLADVRNPLTGPAGARVFASQKGATPDVEERLAAGLERLAQVTQGGLEFARQDGAGAAGGLGFGVLCFGGGSLVSGAHWMLERAGFATALRDADLVLCGEGAFDATSLGGKLTGVALAAAREAGVPAGLLAPRAAAVPAGVMLETGGGRWTSEEVARRATLLVQRALRAAREG